MAFVNFVTFVALKILDNLVSIEDSLNANFSTANVTKNFENSST